MNCQCCQDRLVDLVDGALASCDCAEVEAHLACCTSCCAVRDELRALAEELPGLSCVCEIPADLGRRMAARCPAPRPSMQQRWQRMHLVELRRVASYGIVFVGLWWTLAGGSVTSFAEQELLPRAQAVVDRARAGVEETGVVPLVEGARERVDGASRIVKERVFGARPASEPAAAPQDGQE